MSTKAPGPVIILPDEPVAQYSDLLESYFEMLHRLVTQALSIPNSVNSILLIVKELREMYYYIREHLENDDGITQFVAEALPPIDLTDLIITLNAWENDPVLGRQEYDKRLPDDDKDLIGFSPVDRFVNYADCWMKFRLWMFEANRALDICRTRIAKKGTPKPARCFYWVN